MQTTPACVNSLKTVRDNYIIYSNHEKSQVHTQPAHNSTLAFILSEKNVDLKKNNTNVHICSSGKGGSIPAWLLRRATAVLVPESSTFGSSSVPVGVDSGRLGLLKFPRFSTSSQLEAALLASTHSFEIPDEGGSKMGRNTWITHS